MADELNMNIKTIAPQLNPLEGKPVDRTKKLVKSDQTHDRDGNGQQTFSEEQEQPPMSEEQLNHAIEKLKNLPATKEHKWQILLEVVGDVRSVLVKDNLGQLIRRIPEKELWTLPENDNPKGHLLKKAA